jgi:phosphoserine phosphatase RsbU/P
MPSPLHNIERRIFGLFHREPPQNWLVRVEFWLVLFYLVLFPGQVLPGGLGYGIRVISGLLFFAVILFAIPIAIRWISARFLWKVRNRLIITYLLMGLAPIVLFVTLAGIAAYVFCGQFATFAAVSEINVQLAEIEAENSVFAAHISHEVQTSPGSSSVSLPELPETLKGLEQDKLMVAAFRDGKRLRIDQAGVVNQADVPLPSWTKNSFRGVVIDGGKVYLRALNTYREAGHTTTVISSFVLSPATLERVAKGLGRVDVMPGEFEEYDASSSRTTDDSGSQVQGEPRRHKPVAITGGNLPPREHFYDIPVFFPAPLNAVDWNSGALHHIGINVDSRPSVLYRRLFSTLPSSSEAVSSLQVGALVQEVLIGIAVFFAILELFAFFMAVRLNRTITQSIHDLYQATSEIDAGNFSHRISVRRNDQLAALSGSFNKMTSSVERLLGEQREKERLQNELSIAQEVQASLFPSSNITLSSLELHGFCRPARSVSGDYYDFLLFSEHCLGLALGDISGKGISAALLMATLHSAVRAYRFVGEELAHPSVPELPMLRVAGGSDGLESDHNGWFTEPARILAMLNRHLYRSTQPEKYATLFLGHYDGVTRKLTYSNGGQLPPLLLHADDRVSRLDCGGTVVGLMDNVTYQQQTVTLHPGDLLIAYSDGVTEPENEFGEFGEEKLLEIIRRNRYLPLTAICDQVMLALRSWIGDQEQPDDITLVLARAR